MKKLLYATNNPGKQEEVAKFLGHHDITVLSPNDFGINIDPNESGSSLEENAKIKSDSFLVEVDDPDVIVMADDTGVEIDALGGKPGIHVRRWKGYRMEDEEIIEYCINQMKDVKDGRRGAQFRTVLTIGTKAGVDH